MKAKKSDIRTQCWLKVCKCRTKSQKYPEKAFSGLLILKSKNARIPDMASTGLGVGSAVVPSPAAVPDFSDVFA